MKDWLKSISPKVYLPVVIGLGAALALWLLTGNDAYLVGVLVSLTGGAAGYSADPAPRVTQAEVNRISRSRQPRLGHHPPRGPEEPPVPPRHRPLS